MLVRYVCEYYFHNSNGSFVVTFVVASNQHSWTEWKPSLSCSAGCGGGNIKTKRYRLIPPHSDANIFNIEFVESVDETCNTDSCPWIIES